MTSIFFSKKKHHKLLYLNQIILNLFRHDKSYSIRVEVTTHRNLENGQEEKILHRYVDVDVDKVSARKKKKEEQLAKLLTIYYFINLLLQ